ncbi:MAG TPA: hypothetical protein VF295_10315 [Candidatus Limnocylindria bacterium]|jgi:hypothetical protein
MAGAAAKARLGARLKGLLGLPSRLAGLEGEARERADRLLDVRVVTGRTSTPRELEGWLARQFGSADAVREQRVVKVANLATLEATLFAPLRARRPIDGASGGRSLADDIAATEDDPFCSPETGTPAEPFGRIRGAHMVSGANAAMADEHHAVLVFDTHDPLAFDAPLVADLFSTGREWADRARADDPEAANYMLIWNCLWRAGGSIIHGHAQALLGSGLHYARLERFHRAAVAYRAAQDRDLVADIVELHRDVGLAMEASGVMTIAHLTPIKERELVVIGRPGTDERDPAFTDAVARVLIAYRDRIGVSSFNLALWRAPLDGRWPEFAPMVRLVDRGDPFSRPSDIGAMELYGTPIVGSDPYEVMSHLR